jgi:uncharacterized membrane protein
MVYEPPARKNRPFRRILIRGIAVILPTVLTVALLVMVGQFVADYVAAPINRGVISLLTSNEAGREFLRWRGIDIAGDHDFLDLDALPNDLRNDYNLEGTRWDEQARKWVFTDLYLEKLDDRRRQEAGFFSSLEKLYVDPEKVYAAVYARALPFSLLPAVGFVVAVGVVFLFGFLASGFVGRRLIAQIEHGLFGIPVVRAIYPYAKQVVDFFFSEESRKKSFTGVVAVPYPHRDSYSLAFSVGEGLPEVNEKLGGRTVTCFIPSSPTPFTGYAVFVREDLVVRLPITVDQAIRFVVSGGVLGTGLTANRRPGEPVVLRSAPDLLGPPAEREPSATRQP